jgi:hypothetical protein
MCPTLKKLSKIQQPFREVLQIVDGIRESDKGYQIRILEHLLSYAEYQFGRDVRGVGYLVRGDGERFSSWNAEIAILHNINLRLMNIYHDNHSLSSKIRDDMMLPYLERSLSILNPWLVRINSLNEEQKEILFQQLTSIEENLAVIATNRNQLDLAEVHCQRCLAYSKRLKGKEKRNIDLKFDALKIYCTLRDRQEDSSGALSFAEEGYNLIEEAYDCAHPQAQVAEDYLYVYFLYLCLIGWSALFM